MSKQQHEKYEETQSGTIDISDIKEPYSDKLEEADFSNYERKINELIKRRRYEYTENKRKME